MSESGKPSCARHYLAQQLDMLPNATVVAFGGKAQHYVKHLRVEHLAAYALAPPGANHKPARPSWERVITTIEERRLPRARRSPTGPA